MENTRVLIVDDDPNINQLIKLYLEKEGFETETATRGDDALNLFKKNPPHIVLLDLMLPGMDGWQVCREIRKISTIPIIMLTAKDETFDKVCLLYTSWRSAAWASSTSRTCTAWARSSTPSPSTW